MNTEMHEKDYDYITLMKNHSEIFTYDPQNDIYHCEMYHMSIGNKKSLQRHIENFCKANEKENIGKLFEDYKDNELVTAYYSADKNRYLVLPIKVAFENISRLLEEAKHLHKQDKFIAGTIEAGYDNYLSVEEEADIAEMKSVIDKSHDELEY